MRSRTRRLIGPLAAALLTTMCLGSRPLRAAPPEWTQLPPVPVPSSPGIIRHGHSAIVDLAHQSMVVFGGIVSGSNAVLSTLQTMTLDGNATWSTLALGGGPGARFGHSAIYDAPGGRMIVFGGQNIGVLNDLWSLDLSVPSWAALTQAGAPPPARFGHVAIFDPVRRRMIVFGGFDGSSYLHDVWALSLTGTPTWTQLFPGGTAPSPRDYSCAIYDPVRDRMLVFSGNDGSTTPSDVWALSLGASPAWSKVSTAGPTPPGRLAASAQYDPSGDRMVVFGGWGYIPGSLGDTWELSLSGPPTWAARALTSIGPTPRYSASMVLDAARGGMVLFAGYASTTSTRDVDFLDLSGGFSWRREGPSPPLPEIYSSSMVIDRTRGRAVLFGGLGSGSPSDDTWLLQLTTANAPWALAMRLSTAPAPRRGHSAVVDPAGDRMIVFGGFNGNYLGDTWSLDLATLQWKFLVHTGGPPTPRDYHDSVWDPVRGRMLMFGGNANGVFLNDLWQLDLNGFPSWTRLAPDGTPPSPRLAHRMVYDAPRDRVVLFGGSDGLGNDLNETWALELSPTLRWVPLAPSGVPPSPRYSHSMIIDEGTGTAVMVGGLSGGISLSDVWRLSFSPALAWSSIATDGGPPPGRHGQVMAYDPFGLRLVMAGGAVSGDGYLNDTWFLPLVSGATPVLASVAMSGISSERVALTWYSAAPPTGECVVVRRELSSPWREVARKEFDGTGRLAIEDRSVVPGSRYEYALLASGESTPSASFTVDVPRGATLSLAGSEPNPASGSLRIRFSLAAAGPASLDVFDVSGRLAGHREVGSLGPGSHLVPINAVGPGLYWVRLTAGSRQLRARVAVVN